MSAGPWVRHAADLVTIGRSSANSVVVAGTSISRTHVRVTPTAGGWIIEDVSSYGTFADGRPVGRLLLGGETLLRLGAPDSDVSVALRVAPAADSGPAGRPTARYTGVLTIGRSRANDIVVDDLLVSRRHARARVAAGGVTIEDLGSHNGTIVDGARVNGSVFAPDGALVTVGGQSFAVRDGGLEPIVEPAAVLEARGVTVRAGDGRVLLSEASARVAVGQVVAIAGPSGAGKSTFVRALTGLTPPSAGRVVLDGYDLSRHYSALKNRLGYVPQDDVVHGHLGVRRALSYAARLRFAEDVTGAEREARVTEVLRELSLEPVAGQQISTLSGGQRKRVNVAFELLPKPRVLILDEPTSGLDPGTERAVLGLLRDLADAGRAVFVVTHSLASLDFCDDVVFLRSGGRVAYNGAPAAAAAYFQRKNLADVYSDLESTEGIVVANPTPPGGHDENGRPAGQAAPRPPPRRPWRQLSVLTSRYAAIIIADRRNLTILLAQAPLLGLLTRALLEVDGLGPGRSAPNTSAGAVVLFLVLSATWLGGANAIREIVKELPIYRRERAVGLGIGPYLASKFVVLSGLTALQGTVLVLVAVSGRPTPGRGSVLANGLVELILDVTFSGLAAMALALLVSAVVSSADKALAVLPILLVPQLILSGGLLDLSHRPVLDGLSYVASARWGYAAAASTVDLRRLQTPPRPGPAGTGPGTSVAPAPNLAIAALTTPHTSPLWRHDAGTWGKDVAGLAGLTVLFLGGAAWALRRRDPAHRDRSSGARSTGRRRTG